MTTPIKNLYIFGSKNNNASLDTIFHSKFGEEAKKYQPTFIKDHLDEDKTALLEGADAIVCTLRDRLNAKVIEHVSKHGIKLILLWSLSHEGIDLDAIKKHNIQIAYCPHYSPESLAEYSMALLLTINRHIHHAYNKVREDNFELDGLLGMDLHAKTIGILGFGKIGRAMAKICLGFGMKVLAFDKTVKNEEKLNVEFASLEETLTRSDIVSLHLALNEETKYIINEKTLALMKKNSFLINTARGQLINTQDLLNALIAGKFSGVGLDVFEDKQEVFFRNSQGETLLDETLSRLITIPRVLMSCRQGWFTIENIMMLYESTFRNLQAYNESGKIIDSIY